MTDSSTSPSPQFSLQSGWHQVRQSLLLFRYCGRALDLVWQTSPNLTLAMGLLTVLTGLLPGAIAFVGKLIVDAVIQAAGSGLVGDRWLALRYLGLEAVLVILLSGGQKGISFCQSILHLRLEQKVNELILRKALTLSLIQFEDAEIYDKMTRAWREASARPVNMVNYTFGLGRDFLSLLTYGGLLLQFSGWALGVLTLASVPAFIAEARFAQASFRLLHWRTPETRERQYLEYLLTRDHNVKEIKLFQLGSTFLDRHRAIFNRLYADDHALAVRRSVWSYGLGLISNLAFYSTYVWIVLEAIAQRISLGELTLYLTVFRQGQATFSNLLFSISHMYEDALYLSNLYEFLEAETPEPTGWATHGPRPDLGLQFEQVSFAYPGSSTLALSNVSFHLKPGEKLAIVGENGSGKTTLIKLLTRLYSPTEGRIWLDGRDLQEWDLAVLHQRIGAIFQDFIRYQFTVGENIGVGDIQAFQEEPRWAAAADKGTARPFIDSLDKRFQTQLGKWFRDGQELSGGQWQKIALSRAFMRSQADILILDEPTAAVDAAAEAEIFSQFRALTKHQMAILISHRFSTVRMADQIIVLDRGKLIEQGSHGQLLQANGHYATLFNLQAAGYR
jgi:ABC-type multidrug transport system fused ATPase/permease subunit